LQLDHGFDHCGTSDGAARLDRLAGASAVVVERPDRATQLPVLQCERLGWDCAGSGPMPRRLRWP
jgi:hypothetical protein